MKRYSDLNQKWIWYIYYFLISEKYQRCIRNVQIKAGFITVWCLTFINRIDWFKMHFHKWEHIEQQQWIHRDVDNGSRGFYFWTFYTFYTISRMKRISYTYQEVFPHKPLLNPFAYNQKAFMIFFEIVYNADLCFLPAINIKTSFWNIFSSNKFRLEGRNDLIFSSLIFCPDT